MFYLLLGGPLLAGRRGLALLRLEVVDDLLDFHVRSGALVRGEQTFVLIDGLPDLG